MGGALVLAEVTGHYRGPSILQFVQLVFGLRES